MFFAFCFGLWMKAGGRTRVMNKKSFFISAILISVIMWCNCCIKMYASEIEPENCKVEIIEENEWTIQDYIDNYNRYIEEEKKLEESSEEPLKVNEKRKSISKSLTASSAKHSGTYKSINWIIYDDGLLVVSGVGEYKEKNPDKNHANCQPWYDYATEITKAKVSLIGTRDLSQMFWKCSNLEEVEFDNPTTLYPTNMQGMFSGCSKLKKISWGAIEIHSVEDMSNMFNSCYELDDLDLSRFNTANVKDMSAMFAACYKLKTLDLSSLNTAKVEDMYNMFAVDIGLEDIKFGTGFITSKVKCMDQMFAECESLEELDLARFNFSQITNNSIRGMIFGCENLKKVKNVGDVNLDLYVNYQLKNVFGWRELGKQTEVTSILSSYGKSTYERYNKVDYWDKFTNIKTFFTNDDGDSLDEIEDMNYYYITESDYNKLMSQLPNSEKVNVAGGVNAYFYYALDNVLDGPKDVTRLRSWEGSCYGMSLWVALHNNKWVTLQGGLSGKNIDYNLISMINFYHVQQHLKLNTVLADEICKENADARIDLIKSTLRSGTMATIEYEWEKINVETGKKETKAHTVYGLAVRDAGLLTTTDLGKDVSGYNYCVVVYDPASEIVSTHSDCNIYINNDGSFYVPYKDLKGGNDTYPRIKRVSYLEEYINAVDYSTGKPSNKVLEESTNNYIRLLLGKPYIIRFADSQISINENGTLEGENYGASIIADSCDSVDGGVYITVSLPEATDYSVYASDEFEAYMLGTYFTSYAWTTGGGEIVFEQDGDTCINTNDEADKIIYTGINDGHTDNPWTFIYAMSGKGCNLATNIEEKKVLIEGDNLESAYIRLMGQFNEETEPIVLPQGTTRAVFTKEEGDIIVEHDGDAMDDDNNATDKYDVSFEVIDSWNSGYNAVVRIENISEDVLDNWILSFEYDGEISSIWNAQIVSHVGNEYIIKNVGWNQDILPGQTIEFGVGGQEDFGVPPVKYALISHLKEHEKEDFDIGYQIASEWDSGFTAYMSVMNYTDYTIEDWIIEFDYDAEITDIWDAEIVSHKGSHYIVKNNSYNGNIVREQNVTFGFNGIEIGDNIMPADFKLYSRE